jgi:hypothetical protein
VGGRRVVAGPVDEMSVDELSLALTMSCRSMSYQRTPNDIRTIDAVSLLMVEVR